MYNFFRIMYKLKFILLPILIFPQFVVMYTVPKRHLVYWDTSITPRLKNRSYVLNVEIGQFLDILCPHQLLENPLNSKSTIVEFDLYNVTQKQFESCNVEGERSFVFACDRPEKENKLTIKFQVISPSPYGFRFQYCQDYFLLAKTRLNKQQDCNSTSGMKISVSCKDDPTIQSTTSQKRIPPKLSPTPIDSYDQFITKLKEQYDLTAEKNNFNYQEPIIVPELKILHVENSKKTESVKSKNVGGGHNSACNIQKTSYLCLSFLCILSILWPILITKSGA